MQLEVLICWLDALNRSSQNEVFRIFTDLLMSGGVIPRHVQRVYEICSRISRKSNPDEETEWAKSINKRSEEYILKHMKSLVIPELYNIQLVNFMFIYAESVTDLSGPPNLLFVEFLFSYLKAVCEHKVKRK